MDKSIIFGKKPIPKFKITPSKEGDVSQIMDLVNGESGRSGALLKITEDDVKGWIHDGFSYVARYKKGEIVGHLSAHLWPKSQWVELRSSIVKPEFRGLGISSSLCSRIIKAINRKYGKKVLVAFTNQAGRGKGILVAMGFHEAEYDELPKELFTIGPAFRGKKEFGYKIFILTEKFPQRNTK